MMTHSACWLTPFYTYFSNFQPFFLCSKPLFQTVFLNFWSWVSTVTSKLSSPEHSLNLSSHMNKIISSFFIRLPLTNKWNHINPNKSPFLIPTIKVAPEVLPCLHSCQSSPCLLVSVETTRTKVTLRISSRRQQCPASLSLLLRHSLMNNPPQGNLS